MGRAVYIVNHGEGSLHHLHPRPKAHMGCQIGDTEQTPVKNKISPAQCYILRNCFLSSIKSKEDSYTYMSSRGIHLEVLL